MPGAQTANRILKNLAAVIASRATGRKPGLCI
jgi:hypothetical protein